MQAADGAGEGSLGCVVASRPDSLTVEPYAAGGVLATDHWLEIIQLFQDLRVVKIGAGAFSRAPLLEAILVGRQQDLPLDYREPLGGMGHEPVSAVTSRFAIRT
jgi:hypothetical protein